MILTPGKYYEYASNQGLLPLLDSQTITELKNADWWVNLYNRRETISLFCLGGVIVSLANNIFFNSPENFFGECLLYSNGILFVGSLLILGLMNSNFLYLKNTMEKVKAEQIIAQANASRV